MNRAFGVCAWAREAHIGIDGLLRWLTPLHLFTGIAAGVGAEGCAAEIDMPPR